MRRVIPSRSRALSISAVVALAAAAVLVSPTAATAATTNLTVDCNSLAANQLGSQYLYVAPGDSFTFALTGFDSVYDYDTGTDIATLNPAGDTYELFVGDNIDFYDTTNTCSGYLDVQIFEAAPETIPSGNLLFTRDITIPVGAPEFTVTETIDDEHLLGGDPGCAISTEIHGKHVYGTQVVTVLAAGTFTFRGISSNPAGYYSPLQPYDPLGDPFLAVYKNFDPANPDLGVVGCNDDLNDVGPENDAEYFADRSILEGHQPYFTAVLQPGTYTLVLATWEDLSSEDFAAGYGPLEQANFAVGAKSTRFQLWGPAGSLALGAASSGGPAAAGPTLAATGVDSAAADSALGLGVAMLLLGGIFAAFTRHRRRTGRTA